MTPEEDNDEVSALDNKMDVSASEGDVVEPYDEADQIAYGEEGNQMRTDRREQANFYVGGTTPTNGNATETGNPGGGEPNPGRTVETGGVRPGFPDALLDEQGMHITENP